MLRSWKMALCGALITTLGALTAHLVQTVGGVTVRQVTYPGGGDQMISALLYTPPLAPGAKAPAILAVHGYINSREVQSGFAIEFARRGYIVLTPDQSGHGYSDAPAFANGFGGPASLTYLRSLADVDTDNIGLEGHSMGGWTVLAAAATQPDGYKSLVLEGSSTGAPFAADGTTDWPRNTAVVFSKYDEFASLMWGVDRGLDVAESPKLQALFNTTSPVIAGQVYGDIQTGTARVLYQPPVTHPGDHISTAAIGYAVDWFGQTLDGASPLPSKHQIWMWKEAATFTALIGFVILLLGTFDVLLQMPYLARLKAPPASAAFDRRTAKWWAIAATSIILPVATFYPVFKWAEHQFPASALLPQTVTTQIAIWAVVNGIIVLVIGLLSRSTAKARTPHVAASALIAVATISIGYLAAWLAHALANVDFRIWFVGVKVLSAAQAPIALVYAVPLAAYFLLASRALHTGLSVAGDSRWRTYATNAAIMAGGFAVFLCAQYIALFSTGKLLTPTEPLNTIIMLQFVPLMLIVSIISTFTYRRTASSVPGAIINTLFVTWYAVAGQATHFAAP